MSNSSYSTITIQLSCPCRHADTDVPKLPYPHHHHKKFTDLHCCRPHESVFQSTSFPGFAIDRKGVSPPPRTARTLCAA
ncbi:putative proline-rich receptor-like protein kinase PERK3 [Iris pallida]|uniref:Proline-rich receptor-like protein kinase PERK3 n=1 Tax=Iris pallida TaxID=29817 RepID=A0AAX6HAQ6_IRIPA|nr:putative proline-rich receptor-like protein kinase PERK3 [Iris pallida]